MLRVLTALEDVFSRYIPWHSETEMRNALQAITDLKNEITGANLTLETPAVETPDPTNPVSAATETPQAGGTADVVADTTTNATSVSDSTIPDVNATDANAVVNIAAEPEPIPFPGSYTPPPAA